MGGYNRCRPTAQGDAIGKPEADGLHLLLYRGGVSEVSESTVGKCVTFLVVGDTPGMRRGLGLDTGREITASVVHQRLSEVRIELHFVNRSPDHQRVAAFEITG